MSYLADTNVIIRRIVPGDSQYITISAALTLLDEQGEVVYITAQNLIEFQALATHPVTANGWGLTSIQASAEAQKIEAIFPLLPEIPTIYPLWRNLSDSYNVVGRQVFDARLVAVMMAHGISHLLTLNPTDFRRFPMISVKTPEDVLTPASS